MRHLPVQRCTMLTVCCRIKVSKRLLCALCTREMRTGRTKQWRLHWQLCCCPYPLKTFHYHYSYQVTNDQQWPAGFWKGGSRDEGVCGRNERDCLFQFHSPSHSQWFIPIPISNPRFSLALFPFPSHSRWLFPFPFPIPGLA